METVDLRFPFVEVDRDYTPASSTVEVQSTSTCTYSMVTGVMDSMLSGDTPWVLHGVLPSSDGSTVTSSRMTTLFDLILPY